MCGLNLLNLRPPASSICAACVLLVVSIFNSCWYLPVAIAHCARMRLIIQETPDTVAAWAATYVVKRIRSFAPTPDRPFILGWTVRWVQHLWKGALRTHRSLTRHFHAHRSSYWQLSPADVQEADYAAQRWRDQLCERGYIQVCVTRPAGGMRCRLPQGLARTTTHVIPW